MCLYRLIFGRLYRLMYGHVYLVVKRALHLTGAVGAWRRVGHSKEARELLRDARRMEAGGAQAALRQTQVESRPVAGHAGPCC